MSPLALELGAGSLLLSSFDSAGLPAAWAAVDCCSMAVLGLEGCSLAAESPDVVVLPVFIQPVVFTPGEWD
jgi:hypothetical protein